MDQSVYKNMKLNKRQYVILVGVFAAFITISLTTGIYYSFKFIDQYPDPHNPIPFVVAKPVGPSTLDPIDAIDVNTINTIMQVCEGLYRYNFSSTEMEPIPCLAESMGIWSQNSTVLTVKLKQNVTFHDGSIFNAYSVKWNFDRIQYWTYGFDVNNDGTLESHSLGCSTKKYFAQNNSAILNHTEVVEEFIVKFVLNLPSSSWENLLANLACSIVLPDENYEMRNSFFSSIDINDELIGTGPYKLIDYEYDFEYGLRIQFNYNPNYHMEWSNQHVNVLIYRIITDPEVLALAMRENKIHWLSQMGMPEQLNSFPNYILTKKNTTEVYFIRMNLYTIPQDIRLATSFVWNDTYLQTEILHEQHNQLVVPIPFGMQYHHSNFASAPFHNYTKAQHIILNSSDIGIQTNLTIAGLNGTSTRDAWREIAEGANPIAVFNFTRYYSGFTEQVALLLQDCLKDIGIKLLILDPLWDLRPFEDLIFYTHPERLAFSLGSWDTENSDPISMIEPLYGENGSENCFMFYNTTWNQKLLETYSVNGSVRQELFNEIQEDFVSTYVPSLYILQLEEYLIYNDCLIDENTVSNHLNIFSYEYWFTLRFTYMGCNLIKFPFGLVIPVLAISIVLTFSLIIIQIKRRKIMLIDRLIEEFNQSKE